MSKILHTSVQLRYSRVCKILCLLMLCVFRLHVSSSRLMLLSMPSSPHAALDAIIKGLPPMPRTKLLAPFEGAFDPFRPEDPTQGGCPRVPVGVRDAQLGRGAPAQLP
jgi:hypothetical protein